MAARRIGSTAIDWAAFAARVPEGQKPMFNAFKGKSDAYLRRVLSLPETTPKINFDAYKARITVPGMVEQFQKQYEALEVPYPADTVSVQITEVETKAAAEVEVFIKESEARIAKLKEELVQWEKMIPFNQMTLEEFVEQFPDKAINLENPTLWPHTPEEQPGYVAKEVAEA
ncbi:ATP synthase subunit d, mitochondrial-like [Homarus americanus]|uniref:ATP synthase subunit d, mitochondrial n=1 Tax=Homarus americanus TaxID=6706 RepID=A0A8J5MT12_HOMAM|nr:ATP synthase subunit d, mitochondrial-like [Homarus americanus]KAG7163145.1 ATP synthase subunit d-like [Homarus americanus]